MLLTMKAPAVPSSPSLFAAHERARDDHDAVTSEAAAEGEIPLTDEEAAELALFHAQEDRDEQDAERRYQDEQHRTYAW